MLLPPNESYEAVITMPQPLHPIPLGQYSMSLKYRNYLFGADGPKDSGQFIDYHGWMGEIESNIVSFSIVPDNK